MAFLSQQKRKNDQPRFRQWWLLVVGIVIGVISTLIFTQRNSSGSYVTYEDNPPAFVTSVPSNVNILTDDFQLTATHIIENATATAAAINP